MGITTKHVPDVDANNVLRGAHNVEDLSISTNGFIVGQVGRRVDMALATTNVADDTEVYTFSDNDGSLQLYVIEVVYTDDTRATMLFSRRTA